MNCRLRRHLLFAAACLGALSTPVYATPASAVFNVDQSNSPFTITVTARGLTDSDVNNLLGTIDATFDFGRSGMFPAIAAANVTGSHVTPNDDYEFTLGFPQIGLGVAATASGLVADTTTLVPPATLTKIGSPPAYQFDASQFNIALVEGVITVSGLINDTADLSEENPPLGGNSPVGTIGTINFTPGAMSGPYTLIDAVLTLPINIDRTVMFGDPPNEEPVDLSLDGSIRATASFYAALAGVPGDFDDDNDVDDADYALWRVGFGTATGAMLDDGDANADGDADGEDFLIWQKNRGLAPPPIGGASTVPEPASMAVEITALATSLLKKRRRATSSQQRN